MGGFIGTDYSVAQGSDFDNRWKRQRRWVESPNLHSAVCCVVNDLPDLDIDLAVTPFICRFNRLTIRAPLFIHKNG